jgi:ribosomal protein S18 acetylase RimI-like enzyme
VNVRRATSADVDLLLSLVERLESELPPLPYPEDPAELERAKVEKMVGSGVALLAEDNGEPVAYLLARYGEHGPTTVYVSDLWVERGARGGGLGADLLRRAAAEAAEHGCTHVVLDVDSRNTAAIAFYERLGFEEGAKIMRIGVDALTREEPDAVRADIGAVHVQTDDSDAVERVLAQHLPRVDRSATATVERGSTWTTVRVETADRSVLRKLAVELSFRFGVTLLLALEREAVVHFVLHEQGRNVDEYLSLPEYYGPLPPGDALALRANPTVVSRLTGADPARVRGVVRTAASSRELPPPRELYEQVAEVLGVVP